MSALESFVIPAAIALPLLAALGVWLAARRQRRVARSFAIVGTMPWSRIVLVLLGALALSGALATATIGSRDDGGAGGAVILVLDVSNSMLAEDADPNRLELLRSSARRLLSQLEGTPVGLVVFAGRAYALSPPTTDPEALELYLGTLDPQMVTQTGTSLAAAVRQAVGLLATTRARTGTAVLISDGNAPETPADIDAATAAAARAGVRVHAVGIGTPEGAPVPRIDFRTGRADGFIPAAGGGVAISRLDEALLRRVAADTRGEYLHVTSAASVDRLGTLLAGGAVGAGRGGEEPTPPYAWFAGAALLLLLTEAVVTGARRLEP